MRKLYRDRWDKKIAGVCGGLGRLLRVDPTIVRLIVAILCLLTAVLPLVVFYIIAWILIPLGPSTYIHFPCKKLYRSKTNRRISGICGGLATMLRIDATFIRLATFILMIVTGFAPVIIMYILGSLIIPDQLS